MYEKAEVSGRSVLARSQFAQPHFPVPRFERVDDLAHDVQERQRRGHAATESNLFEEPIQSPDRYMV